MGRKCPALVSSCRTVELLENRVLLDGNGQRAEFFPTANLSGTPVMRNDPAINFNWGIGAPDNALPPDGYSVRWSGRVQAAFTETYTFSVTAQGGARLWVNGVQLINQWAATSGTFTGNIALSAAQLYSIKLEYAEKTGNAAISLSWSSPSQSLQVIPTSRLYSWTDAQIGSGLAGSSSYNSSTGVYTVTGSGRNLLEYPDTYFSYQQMTGDCEIVARLTSKSDDWSSVGLMIREGLGVSEQRATAILSSSGQFYFRTYGYDGSAMASSSGRSTPVWIRLVRSGDTFTTYVSDDGESWLGLQGRNISMGETVNVGMFVSSNNLTSTVTATFDNVRISTPQWGYDTSWIGNSFNGAGQWVQNDIKGFFVASDGTIFANSTWDEGGSEAGVYKDQKNLGRLADLHGWGRSGGWAVTADANYVYALVGQGNPGWDQEGYPPSGSSWNVVRRYSRSTFRVAPFSGGSGGDGSMLIVNTSGSAPTGIHVSGNQLFVSDPTTNVVKVYNKTTMTLTSSFSVPRPGQITEDGAGNLWIISNSDASNGAKVLQYSKAGVKQSREITTLVKPTSIAYNTTNGQLLVADDGPTQQIHMFNISLATPAVVGTLGDYGGMASGTPGLVTPTKFDNPSGVGVDSAGNIYVAFQGMEVNLTWIGLGSVIRKFSPTGASQWELHGLEFVDSAVADPTNDGLSVYTKDSRYLMDYTKTDGQEYTWVGRTAIESINGDDTRLSGGGSSVWMQVINGHKFMYVTGQGGMNLDIYRFEAGTEIAIQCGAILETAIGLGYTTAIIWTDVNGDGVMQDATELFNTGAARREDGWGFSVDTNGAVWASGIYTGLRKYTMTSVNQYGCPVFSTSVSSFSTSPITNNGRAFYDPATDTMILSGYTSANPRGSGFWGEAGRELVRFNNWSGSRTVAWRAVLPYDETPATGDPVLAKSIDVAGNRIFVAMATTGTILVYDRATGQQVAEMPRGPEIGGYGGWLDTVQPMSSFRRADGEYLVFVEEDLLAKIVMYRAGGVRPASLSATSATPGAINLNWIDQCTRESGFVLQHSTNGTTFTTIANLPANMTSYALTGMQGGLTHYFRIKATNSFDDSPYTAVVSTFLAASPDAPSNLTATAVSASQINLTWTDNSTTETGFRIERATDSQFTQNLMVIATPSANVASFNDSGLSPSTTYFYRVSAMSGGSSLGMSGVASATTPLAPVPAPWSSADVGTVGIAGSSSYFSGTFTLVGSGADIWDVADGFRFVHQPLSGDGQIVARVASLTAANEWGKSGVMIRESLTAGSRHASTFITTGNGLAFQYRAVTGGASLHMAGGSATAPVWVKLVRQGNTFTSYSSTDGSTWTTIGSTNITMGTNVYIGLAVTSHDNAASATTTIDSVSVSTLQVSGDQGSAGQSDQIRVARNATDSSLLEVFLNSATPTYSVSFAALRTLVINGLGGDDTLTLDLANGPVIPAGGISYDGGMQAGGDNLIITGASGNDAIALSTNQVTINSGVVTLSGVENRSLSGVQHLGSLTLAGGSKLTLPEGGQSTLVVQSLSVDATSSLDVADNSVIVDYTGSNPFTGIYSMVASSAANHWAGNGIVSHTAAGGGSEYAIGVADNSVANLASFAGQSVDATSVLIRFTYSGDANLDGQVDLTDLSILAGSWQMPGRPWGQGDSDYSGSVDLTDLSLLAANWQKVLPAPAPAPVAAPVAAEVVSLTSDAAAAAEPVDAATTMSEAVVVDPAPADAVPTEPSSGVIDSSAAVEGSETTVAPVRRAPMAAPPAAGSVLIDRAGRNPLRAGAKPAGASQTTAALRSGAVFSDRPLPVASVLASWPITSQGARTLLGGDRGSLSDADDVLVRDGEAGFRRAR